MKMIGLVIAVAIILTFITVGLPAALSLNNTILDDVIQYLENNSYAYAAPGDTFTGNVDATIVTADTLNAPTGRTATYVIAASDAPDHVKAQADVVCDGTDDREEIESMIAGLSEVPVTGQSFTPVFAQYDAFDAVGTWVALNGDETLSIETNTMKVVGVSAYPGIKQTGLTLDWSAYNCIQLDAKSLYISSYRIKLYDATGAWCEYNAISSSENDWVTLTFDLQLPDSQSALYGKVNLAAITQIDITCYKLAPLSYTFYLDNFCLNKWTDLDKNHAIVYQSETITGMTRDVDYLVDWLNGKIRAIYGGAMVSGNTYSVDYSYSPGGIIKLSSGTFNVPNNDLIDASWLRGVKFIGSGNTVIKKGSVTSVNYIWRLTDCLDITFKDITFDLNQENQGGTNVTLQMTRVNNLTLDNVVVKGALSDGVVALDSLSHLVVKHSKFYDLEQVRVRGYCTSDTTANKDDEALNCKDIQFLYNLFEHRTAPTAGYNALADRADGWKIIGNIFRNCDSVMDIAYSKNVTCEDNWIFGADIVEMGFYFESGKNITIQNNHFFNCARAIRVSNLLNWSTCGNVKVIGNEIHNSDIAIEVAASHSIISNNTIDGSISTGIQVRTTNVGVISGNIIENGSNGVYKETIGLNGVTCVSVYGNIISPATTATNSRGIREYGASDSNYIYGNQITGYKTPIEIIGVSTVCRDNIGYIAPGEIRTYSQSVVDDASITLETGRAGFGKVIFGDSAEYSDFYFTAAGTVTLVNNTTNVVNTDTDTKYCIYDAGTGVAIKNRSGSTVAMTCQVTYQ